MADLVDALRASVTADDGLSLVAVDASGEVVGHVMFTRSLLEARDGYSRVGFAAGAPQGFRKPSLRIPDAAFQALSLATTSSACAIPARDAGRSGRAGVLTRRRPTPRGVIRGRGVVLLRRRAPEPLDGPAGEAVLVDAPT